MDGTPTPTNSTKTEYPEIPLGNFIGIAVAVFAVIGVFANMLVLVVLSISQRKRYSPYRYLISHLASADLINSIINLVYVPLELRSHHWIYGEHSCKIVYPAITFCTNLAVGTILIISLERSRGVLMPHLSPWKAKDIWTALAAVWVFGFILVLPNIITLKVTSYKNLEYCNEIWDNSDHQKLYGLTFFFLAFFIPLLAIIIMHVAIMYRLNRTKLQPANISQWQVRTNARIMRVLTSIIIAFFITVSPNKILYFVWDVAPSLEKDKNSNVRYIVRLFIFLFYSRVTIDPLLYCFFDTRFKKDLKNTSKTVRGLSFVDSEMSRARARTMSLNRPSSVGLRSRANSYLNGEAGTGLEYNNRLCQSSEIISKLASVPENGHINECAATERSRSDSNATVARSSMCGSSSPLVNPAYMTDTLSKQV